ncbi:unnamed protein product [Mucor fragilis]
MDLDSNELSPILSNDILTGESRDQYHYVQPKKNSKELFNLSNRVDSGTSRVYEEPIMYDEGHRLGSDKRRYLSGEIARLRNELFDCVLHGISKDDTTVEAKRVAVVTMKLQKAEKAFKLLFGQETTLVPAETPFFQWRGNVFNKNKASYKTVEDCLDHFERVLFAHRLSLEDNWQHLVPARLSTNMARWYAQHLADGDFGSWSDFREAVSNKYGRNQADLKEEAREKMERILYDHTKPLDKFIEQFQELKAMADVQDEDCVVRYFLKALPEELADTTKFYLKMNHPDKSTITVDLVISKAVPTYEALFRKKWQQQQASTSNYSREFSSNGDNGSYRRQYQNGKRHHDSNKRSTSKDTNAKAECKYHPGLTGHATQDCLLNQDDKKKIDKIFKKYGPSAKFCYTCKAPNFKKGEHVCPGKSK